MSVKSLRATFVADILVTEDRGPRKTSRLELSESFDPLGRQGG